MAVLATFARVLRDDGDDSGQTVREWRVEAEAGHVTIRNRATGDAPYFLGMRAADIELFFADIRRAADFARDAARSDKKVHNDE